MTGELRAVARSRVATIEEGLVIELPIEEGQIVKAGDRLVVLDSRRLKIGLRRLEGQVEMAKAMLAARVAELALRQHDLDALKVLYAGRASNPKEMADAESEFSVAKARKDEAERNLDVSRALADLVRTRLEDTVVTAPFDGVVVATHTEHGQWLDAGDPIAEIVSVGAYDAWLDIPQRFASSIMGGDALIQVQIAATSRMYPPALPRIVPLVDPIARTFSAYVRIEDEKGHLAPGMSVNGWVPTGQRREFLTVPQDALLQNEAGFYVYVARGMPGLGPETAAAVPLAVRFLFQSDERIVVEARELNDADLVVVEGNERLFPMMPITFDAPSGGSARDGKGQHPAAPGSGEGT